MLNLFLFFFKVDIVYLKLKQYKEKVQEFDRNYHHWIVTEHTQQRMKERKISYSEINLAFKYGKETKNGLDLSITDIPDFEFENMNNYDLKAITYLLPLTIILDKKDKIIKTVYSNNKTYFKERIIADQVRKNSNKYTRKIKGKLKEAEKIKYKNKF